MSTLILATKLYIPPPRPKMVLRPQLVNRLNVGLHGKLTLISAPAGFGKTTLVSEWVADCQRSVAWLSLDEGDNDSTRFLAYLIAALQRVTSELGNGILAVLQSPQPPPMDAMLAMLLNEIAGLPDNLILVLDDYHVLNSQPIDQALAFLLEHLPRQMHLVIATREDPPLPLPRYRVRNQLTELRATDLRFTSDEAAEFINRVMGLNLSADEIQALEKRTEGWLAGLQMAALALQGVSSSQGGEATTQFIQAFSGSHRFVLDYLVEEVLQGQPELTRDFLLQTAILDRLSGSLCDAVTQREDSQAVLDLLERDNLFVVPLDDQRQWYRYHHLFADVLQARLMAEQSHQVLLLHQRASVWYEEHDLPADAIRHALAADEVERVANLIELARPAMDRNFFQTATLLSWIQALPDSLIRARPVLSVDYGLALLGNGDLEAGEARLADAERWLNIGDKNALLDTSPTNMVVADETQLLSLPARIATGRAHYAAALGDTSSTVMYAHQALDLLPMDGYFERAIPAALLGSAYWSRGNLTAAYQAFADFITNMRQAGSILFAVSGTVFLADISIVQGRLNQAFSIYQQALQLSTELSEAVFPGMAELYVGLSELYSEQGNLEAAAQFLAKSEQQGKQAMIPGDEYRVLPAMARIKAAQGDLDRALTLLDEAERLNYRTALPNVRPFAAQKARIWLKQGRLAEALAWVRERGIAIDDDLSYLQEFEHITLARVLIAQYRRDQVRPIIKETMQLLSRLLTAAEAGERIGSVIELLILQALAHEAQNDISSALGPLKRALKLADPESYVRLFIDEGGPMARLLAETLAQGIMPKYGGKLLAILNSQGKKRDDDFMLSQLSPMSPQPDGQPLIEPLTPREREVLQLIVSGQSNSEIATQLVIAITTVKTHVKNIYGKLQVSNRIQAASRAKDLNLV